MLKFQKTYEIQQIVEVKKHRIFYFGLNYSQKIEGLKNSNPILSVIFLKTLSKSKLFSMLNSLNWLNFSGMTFSDIRNLGYKIPKFFNQE